MRMANEIDPTRMLRRRKARSERFRNPLQAAKHQTPVQGILVPNKSCNQ